MLSVAACGVGLAFALYLLVLHTYLLATNQTTLELIKVEVARGREGEGGGVAPKGGWKGGFGRGGVWGEGAGAARKAGREVT